MADPAAATRTVPTRPLAIWRSSPSMRSTVKTISRAYFSKAWPARVSVMPRAWRRKSWLPTDCSKSRMRLLTAAMVRWLFSAAADTLPLSATAANSFRVVNSSCFMPAGAPCWDV